MVLIWEMQVQIQLVSLLDPFSHNFLCFLHYTINFKVQKTDLILLQQSLVVEFNICHDVKKALNLTNYILAFRSCISIHPEESCQQTELASVYLFH